ncbi:hypothetical protein GQ53DRAFT_423891 [Thozetella sp. PMI_491]|nr:hypothetical protein GQ53DRAFT_423891 [Thozetella sp. PMI_491]
MRSIIIIISLQKRRSGRSAAGWAVFVSLMCCQPAKGCPGGAPTGGHVHSNRILAQRGNRIFSLFFLLGNDGAPAACACTYVFLDAQEGRGVVWEEEASGIRCKMAWELATSLNCHWPKCWDFFFCLFLSLTSPPFALPAGWCGESEGGSARIFCEPRCS